MEQGQIGEDQCPSVIIISGQTSFIGLGVYEQITYNHLGFKN